MDATIDLVVARCMGQTRHRQGWLARARARRLERRTGLACGVYRCRVCGSWHVSLVREPLEKPAPSRIRWEDVVRAMEGKGHHA